MYEYLTNALVTAGYLYLGVGTLAAMVIIPFGLTRLDSEADDAGIGFRMLIFPGIVALWPIVLKRYVIGGGEPPQQKDSHR